MASIEGLKCPHCGNTDLAYLSDNGEKGRGVTYLCTAPCKQGENSFDTTQMEEISADDPIHTQCGMQWEPDSEEQVWECYDCGDEYCISQYDVMQDNVECRHCGSRNVEYLED